LLEHALDGNGPEPAFGEKKRGSGARGTENPEALPASRLVRHSLSGGAKDGLNQPGFQCRTFLALTT